MNGVLSPDEALRYAMSLPVTTTITGMEKPFVLRQNVNIARNFKPMTAAEMQAVREKTQKAAADARYELYKVSLKFDNPEARIAHGFPIDTKQSEVQDMLAEQKNTGHPFRQPESQ
jgi:hypothetical protein